MKLEILSKKHCHQLQEFEFANRKWFESLIASRGDDFYCPEAVERHIDESMQAFNQKLSCSLVLIEGSNILGRANLKNVCSKTESAEIGYRIAQNSVGRGLASFCVAELIAYSRSYFSLKTLNAKVFENNPASKRVLEKHHFSVVDYQDDFAMLNGNLLGMTSFRRILV